MEGAHSKRGCDAPKWDATTWKDSRILSSGSEIPSSCGRGWRGRSDTPTRKGGTNDHPPTRERGSPDVALYQTRKTHIKCGFYLFFGACAKPLP